MVRYKGAVDYLHGNVIKGWIIDCVNIGSSVIVDFLLDGKNYSVEANILRPRLKEINYHPTGLCGFEINMHDYNINNIGSIDFKIGDFRIPRTKGFKEKLREFHLSEKYFFIHIPKTAGTTLRYSLYDQFSQENIFPNLADMNSFSGYPTRNQISKALTHKRYSNTSLFMGHYPISMSNMFSIDDRPIKCFSLLREPIDRVISNIYHAKSHFKIPKNFDDSLKSIMKYLDIQANNYQTRHFVTSHNNVNLNAKGLTKKKLTEKDLDNAILNLKKLDYFGLTSDYCSFIDNIKKRYSWNNLNTIEKRNVNKDRDNNLITEELLEYIRENNRIDIEFYSEAEKIYNEKFVNNISSERI